MERLGTSVSTVASSRVASSMSTLVTPTGGRRPNTLCTRGRRRSQSTRSTRLPDWARVMARVTAVKVLPSRGDELDTMMAVYGLSGLLKSRLVRIPRAISAAIDVGCVCAIRSMFSMGPLFCGVSPYWSSTWR